jgi:hypothetical protein
VNLESIEPDWRGQTAVVAAPGMSLTPEVAEACHGYRTIAVNDAWRRVPWADILYACDGPWWRHHEGCPAFAGQRWSTHDTGNNDKTRIVQLYGVRVAYGKPGDTFSTDPAVIHYGKNSGFQAVNMAILKGASRIVLVGFDMRGTHFFGEHPKTLRNPTSFATFIRSFTVASKSLPAGVSIINATPGSDMRCFPIMPVHEALRMEEAA